MSTSENHCFATCRVDLRLPLQIRVFALTLLSLPQVFLPFGNLVFLAPLEPFAIPLEPLACSFCRPAFLAVFFSTFQLDPLVAPCQLCCSSLEPFAVPPSSALAGCL